MRMEGYDDDLPDEEQVIEDVLGENPRARELRLMRAALEQRRDIMRREQQRTTDVNEAMGLRTKLVELDRQIAALKQEEGITSFVEGSVRLSLNKSVMDE